MGNQCERANFEKSVDWECRDSVQVNADVSFTTSDYSSLSSIAVEYSVLVVKCPGDTSQALGTQRKSTSSPALPPWDVEARSKASKTGSFADTLAKTGCPTDQSSLIADKRRALLHRDLDVARMVDRGYHLVSVVCPPRDPDDQVFLVVMAKVHTAEGSPACARGNNLHIVNSPINLERLVGETLVVGSQKLVMSESFEYSTFDREDLLRTIAHETANGGRLTAAWPIAESDGNHAVERADLLFELPASDQFRRSSLGENSQSPEYFAYQVSVTEDPLGCFEKVSADADSHRNINVLSNHMQKALEAGWGVVDVLFMKPDVLIWFLERTVADALVSEPQFEGRLLELTLDWGVDSVEEVNRSLEQLGRDGWLLKTIVNLPAEITDGDSNYYLALFQRRVKRSDASDAGRVNLNRSVHSYSFLETHDHVDFPDADKDYCDSSDVFAPPQYGHARRSLSAQLLSFDAPVTATDEDLPLYEDAVVPK